MAPLDYDGRQAYEIHMIFDGDLLMAFQRLMEEENNEEKGIAAH